jgi:hypothetical protein
LAGILAGGAVILAGELGLVVVVVGVHDDEVTTGVWRSSEAILVLDRMRRRRF